MNTNIQVHIPLKANFRVKSRDVVYDLKRKFLKVGLKKEQPIIDENLYAEVKSEDCMWTLDSNSIIVTLYKVFFSQNELVNNFLHLYSTRCSLFN